MAVAGVTTLPDAVGLDPNNARSSDEGFARVDFVSDRKMFLICLNICRLARLQGQDHVAGSEMEVNSERAKMLVLLGFS